MKKLTTPPTTLPTTLMVELRMPPMPDRATSMTFSIILFQSISSR